jgi:hypothetical protein
MNPIAKTKNSLGFYFISAVFFRLFFIQCFNNGVQLNIGLSSGESNYNKTFYTNSQISSENGSLTIKTGNDANISGANLTAKNAILNIGNNLNISSKQTEEDYSSSGFGFNFGVGVGSGGNGGNIGGGFNISNADMHRLWVDDITTIKATDSMTINVGKDLNLTGAAILSDNLALAVTGNTNKKDLQDSYYSESMSLGISTSMNFGGNGSSNENGNSPPSSALADARATAIPLNKGNPTILGTGGQPNTAPGGSTSISGNYSQNESNRTTYATIGNLDSTLTSSTHNITGGDFEGSLTVDHRLLSEAGRENIVKDFKELGQNLNKNPLTPMGLSILIENYTGHELSWAPGDVARFKEKGNEFATSVPGALTIGMANTIPTDPSDPKYDASRLWLIGQPVTADPKYYKNDLTWAHEGGGVSSTNAVPGFNSMSVFHDKFTEETFLGAPGLLQLSIFPAIPINYYGLIGKSIRSLYEKPANNNLIGGAQ